MADHEIELYESALKTRNVNVVQLFLPELGNLSIHYNDAPFTGEREVTLYVDFDPKTVRVVDNAGDDWPVCPQPSAHEETDSYTRDSYAWIENLPEE